MVNWDFGLEFLFCLWLNSGVDNNAQPLCIQDIFKKKSSYYCNSFNLGENVVHPTLGFFEETLQRWHSLFIFCSLSPKCK